jgi:hypothetical protein
MQGWRKTKILNADCRMWIVNYYANLNYLIIIIIIIIG